MKTTTKLVITVLAVGLIGGGTVFYFMTQKPESNFTKNVIIPVVKPIVDFASSFKKHTEVDKAKAAFALNPEELQGAFKNDETLASEKYLGKILEVAGSVASIASPTDTNIVLLLSIDKDAMSNVSCQMDSRFNDRIKGIGVGDSITIKGICNGVKKDDLLGSTDVILNRCVIVQ